MAEHMPKVDGFLSLIGGMHAGRALDLLPEQQYAKGVNISSRNGLVHTRPAFRQIFSITGIDDGLFKGATTYYQQSGDYLVFCFGATLYQYHINTATLTNHGDIVDSRATRLFFCQANKYLIIQDDVVGTTFEDKAWPIILDGTTIYSDDATVVAQRASDPFEALPKGQMMAYGHGRIFVAVDWLYSVTVDRTVDPATVTLGTDFVSAPRTSFVACDIFKSWDPASVLSCIENTEAGGGAIAVPNELGLITGMTFQRNIQTGTGHGPLVVFAERGAATFSVDIPRELSDPSQLDWENAGLGKMLFETAGLYGNKTIDTVNNDLMFRGSDGIRTLRQTTSEAQSSGFDLSVDDISDEVRIWLGDSSTHQQYASAAYANNRYLLTVDHFDDAQPFSWNGLVCLDTSPTSSLGQSLSPAYDGIWTGLRFYQVLRARKNGTMQHFIFGRGQTIESGLWEFVEETTDLEFNGEAKRPVCRIETRQYFFQQAFALKELEHIMLQFRDVIGTVDYTAFYRTDGHRLWKQMGSGRVVEIGNKGRTHWIKIPLFATECDPSGAPLFLHVGSGFQFAIQWTGIATVGMAQFYLKMLDRPEFTLCDDLNLNTVATDTVVELDDYEYKI